VIPQSHRNPQVLKTRSRHFGTLFRRFATPGSLIFAALLAVPCAAQPSGIVYSTTVPYNGLTAPGFDPFFPIPTVELLVTDAAGNSYVAGAITSNGLSATPGVVQPSYEGTTFTEGDVYGAASPNVFLAKFDSSGNLLFLTYLGGATPNVPYGLAVDKSGNIYLGVEAGFTYIQQGPSYVAQISPDGTALGWVTFVTGGPLLQLAIGPDGSLYGLTQNALAFTATLTKLGSSGQSLGAFSLPAGTQALAVGADGSVYIAGQSTSPTDVNSSFLAKMNPSLSGFAWLTSVNGDPNLIQPAPDGSLWVSGTGSEPSVPITPGGVLQPAGFLIHVSADGSETLASTTLPAPLATLALDSSGNVIFSAIQGFEDYYFSEGFQATPGAQWPCPQPAPGYLGALGFFGKIDSTGQHLLWGTWTGPSVPVGPVTVDMNGNALAAGNVLGQGSITLTAMTPEPGPITLVQGCIAQSGYPSLSGPLAPGEIVSIYNAGFGPEQGVAAQPSGDTIGTELGGVQVLIEGTPVPLLYVSSAQINLVAPYLLNGRTAAHIKIVTAAATSNEVVLGVQPSAPEIFLSPAAPQGEPLAAILNQDGSVNSETNPAHIGGIVSMFVSGVGQTTPAGIDGSIPQAAGGTPVLPVTVTLNATSANVSYAGNAPGLVSGATQVNFQIPQTLVTGAGPPYQAFIVLEVGGASAGTVSTLGGNLSGNATFLWFE
jgi:uncharacterized protein (TIGR03437 family)